jgi:class 3 adenylate cyclase
VPGVEDAPTGTVTFLFTDIEGSTELVKRLGGEYGGLLAAHRRLLRDAFAEEGGREMGTEGDALFYWFPRVRQAVRAAVAAQRALAEHPWPDGSVVRVRMGLHTGEADIVESEVVGMGVHRAARISSAANGGQVLLSPTTAGVVADERLPGVGVRDLGEYRLKDIDAPVRLHQLEIDGLPTEFAPLRAAPAEPAGGPPPPEPGLVLGLVLGAALAAGAIVAAVLLAGGGDSDGGGVAGGTTRTQPVTVAAPAAAASSRKAAAQAYVQKVDGLLRASQPTLRLVKTFVQDVQGGRLKGGAATDRAHSFVLQRQNLLDAAKELDPPPPFADSQTKLLKAVRLSLRDDEVLEDWTRAYLAGDKATADEALKRAVSLGQQASTAKDAFLREYGRVRLNEADRSPSTLPPGF